MKIIEYSKSAEGFLITDSGGEGTGGVILKFSPEHDGELRLGKDKFDVKLGYAFIKNTDLLDGIYTPVFKSSELGEIICEKITVKSGCAAPYVDANTRSISATKKLINTENELEAIKAEISRLIDAVFAKPIF